MPTQEAEVTGTGRQSVHNIKVKTIIYKWLTWIGIQVSLDEVVDEMVFAHTFHSHSTLETFAPTNSHTRGNLANRQITAIKPTTDGS